MSTYHRYRAWPPRRPCPVCTVVTAVRPNGLFRVHPIVGPRCSGSGEVAPPLPTAGTLRSRRLAYLQLLLNLIERHGYKPDLCDRAERTMLAIEADPSGVTTLGR